MLDLYQLDEKSISAKISIVSPINVKHGLILKHNLLPIHILHLGVQF